MKDLPFRRKKEIWEVLIIEHDEFMAKMLRERFERLSQETGRKFQVDWTNSLDLASELIGGAGKIDGLIIASSRCSSYEDKEKDTILFAMKVRQDFPAMPIVSASNEMSFSRELAQCVKAAFVESKLHAANALVELLLKS